MSIAKHENAFLNGFGFPVFPKIIERIRSVSTEYGITNFDFLESSAKLTSGLLRADRPTTSDGYHWFCGLYFIQGSGKIAILFPWATNYDAKGKDKSDRSIAIYFEGQVDIEKLALELIEAMIKFGTEQNKKWEKYYQETAQRHHDYFVFLYRESGGELNPQDTIEYQTAMQREATGYVNQLPDNAINYFKVEHEKPKESKG
jgi:hypothetical protein